MTARKEVPGPTSVLEVSRREIALRKAFLGFTEADARCLKALQGAFTAQRSAFIDALYERLLAFPPTRDLLREYADLDRLKSAQARYFETLTSGDYGAGYVAERLRVGEAHQRAGLEPKWYLGTYAHYLATALPVLWKNSCGDAERFDKACAALVKIVFFDINLALDTYIHADRQQILTLKHYAETIVDNVADGVLVISETGDIESFNQAAERLFGYRAAEMLGRNVRHLMSEPDRSQHDAYLARYRTTGQARCMGLGVREVAGIAKDGRVLTLELTISEMSQQGRRRYIGVLRDIGERKRAEQERLTLSRAIEQSDDTVVITDPEGVIEYVNPSFERVTGFSFAEVKGKSPKVLKSGRHGAAFYRELWQTVKAGRAFRGTFINRRKDGALYYEEKTITPIKDAAGRVTHFVSTGKDITRRLEAEEQLHYLAHHDPVTGLANRALFTDRLEQAIAAQQKNETLLAVLCLDLDRFKVVNDTLGPQLGDRLLAAVGERLQRAVPEGTTVARWGGDEFTVMLDSLRGVDDCALTARRILDALAAPFALDARELFLTASVGIGVYPADGLDAGTLLKHADTALYRAKEKGRNTYQFFKAEMTAKALERLSLETQLRRALERDEFCLHYQPQVSVASGRIVGVEALLRWEHPALGVVSPLDFIPLLEETGLIVPVGEWVLRSACQQARRWWAEGVCPFSVAVNVSPLQLKSPALLPLVEDLAGDCGEAPAGCHLELEITESLLMEQARESALQLEALSALGVGIALDDFGTGYSSLSYLKRFPIDKVKIDRAFIDEVSSDPGDAAIATAIIAMAHTLNKEVVAEGVENEDQLAFLRARGCDKWQGFLKSRAVPATAVTTMLAAQVPPRREPGPSQSD